jgi:hypothetical protein
VSAFSQTSRLVLVTVNAGRLNVRKRRTKAAFASVRVVDLGRIVAPAVTIGACNSFLPVNIVFQYFGVDEQTLVVHVPERGLGMAGGAKIRLGGKFGPSGRK